MEAQISCMLGVEFKYEKEGSLKSILFDFINASSSEE